MMMMMMMMMMMAFFMRVVGQGGKEKDFETLLSSETQKDSTFWFRLGFRLNPKPSLFFPIYVVFRVPKEKKGTDSRHQTCV